MKFVEKNVNNDCLGIQENVNFVSSSTLLHFLVSIITMHFCIFKIHIEKFYEFKQCFSTLAKKTPEICIILFLLS